MMLHAHDSRIFRTACVLVLLSSACTRELSDADDFLVIDADVSAQADAVVTKDQFAAGGDGKCASGANKSCDDANMCTTDSCDKIKGCIYANGNDGAGCTDGDACTEPDQCASGKCKAGAAKTCDDDNACTKDGCDQAKGCTTEALKDGTVCGAGKLCKVGACVEPRILVPAGPFWMGQDGAGSGNNKPIHKVQLSAFLIDRVEVSVARYKACYDAGKCSEPKGVYENKVSAAGDSPKHYNWKGPADRAQHPINGVNWSQATAFCTFVGGRLPTEAEWEKAARGGCELYGADCATKTPKWPWGAAEPDCTRAIFDAGKGIGCGKGTTQPVGGRPAGKSPYGVHDMAGNVVEWVNDRFDIWYYAQSPAKNPNGSNKSSQRGRRGGGVDAKAVQLRSSRRDGDGPMHAHERAVGLRCAWPAP